MLRTVAETFDQQGELLSQSDSAHSDTLTKVTSEVYQLSTSTMVEVGGKRLRGAAQTTQRTLLSDAAGQPPLVTQGPPIDINLSGRTTPCQQWKLTMGEGASRQIETVYYSPDVSPYILRRERSAADGASAPSITSETTQVIAVDVPILLGERMLSGYWRQVHSTVGENTVERLELCCDQVPGGLVSSTATERDASGNRVRWIVTDLSDFADKPTDRQPGLKPDPPALRPGAKDSADAGSQGRRRWRLFPRRGRE